MISANPLHFMRPGDSGGPLVCKNLKGDSVIIGVNSLLSVQSTTALLSMTNVSSDFIDSFIRK
jgi:hypothetical protein